MATGNKAAASMNAGPIGYPIRPVVKPFRITEDSLTREKANIRQTLLEE